MGSFAKPPDKISSPRRNSLVNRNITIAGHRTSVRLEPAMWAALAEICRREGLTMHNIGTAVSEHKLINTSLTAAIRVFTMAYFRAAATEDGHNRAQHGRGIAVVAAIAPMLLGGSPNPTSTGMPYIIGERYISGSR